MRLDTDRQKEQEPKRFEFAIAELNKLGIEIHYRDSTSIKFMFKDKVVTLFPYSGWHSGKTVNDGRGFNNLLKQLKSPK